MLSNINSKDNSNPLVPKNSINSSDASKNAMKKIELIKKGEVGYIEGMDKDSDGVVTMDEFNEYCAENGVSDKAKLQLLQAIQNAKLAKKLQEKMVQKSEEQKAQEEKEDKSKVIYAKKGDDEYNEEMDYNKDDTVTYEEYLKYCAEKQKAKENDKPKPDDKVSQTYQQSDSVDNDEEISVEAQA